MLHISNQLNRIMFRAILRDEKLYPNPYVYNPDRFLEKLEPEVEKRRDPRNYVFGFGRRGVSETWSVHLSL
jgi:cytochrome P450